VTEIVTFEDRWDRREVAAARAVLPTIEDAGPRDRQVRVRAVFGKRPSEAAASPVSLDALADKPWIESVFAEWPCTASVDLPNISGYFAAYDDVVPLSLLGRFPNLAQLAVRKAVPEELAGLPRLVDASFDWSRYAGAPTVGAPGLAALTRLERLQVRDFHYRERADPVAQLTSLRWLSLRGWRNIRALGALHELELFSLGDVDMANLRALRRLSRLRRLDLGGRMDSLAGIEEMHELEDIRFGGRVVRELAPLAALPNLQRLTLNYPDAVKDFSAIARFSSLRRLEMLLGSETEAGRLPNLDFLHLLENLEEVVLLNVDIADRRLDALFELPRLRRIKLTGRAGVNIDELRARRPEIEIDTHLTGEPEGRVYMGAVHYDPPGAGVETWSVFQSLADLLGTSTNADAERLIRAAVRDRDPGLLRRIEFDTEAGAVGIYSTSEEDIQAVARIVGELAPRAEAAR